MSAKNKSVFFIPGFMGQACEGDFLKEAFKEVHSFNYFDYDVSAILEGLRIQIEEKKPQVIYAYSMGGRLLLELYNSNRLNFKAEKVVLESVGLELLEGEKRQERLNIDMKRSQDLLNSFGDFIREWYKLPLWQLSDLEYHKMVETKLALFEHQSFFSEVLLHFSPGAFPKDGHMRKNPMDMVSHQENFIYLAGLLDKKYTAIVSELMNSKLANAHVIKEAGHNIHFQKPERISQLMKKLII